jgi:multidrug efflux pump subunit AcrB
MPRVQQVVPLCLLCPIVVGVCLVHACRMDAGQAVAVAPLALIVDAEYSGANAQTVEDTVVAPIEQQLIGMPKLLHLRSRSTSEGKCSIVISFDPGADLKAAKKTVQERINLAVPILPVLVQSRGIQLHEQPGGLLLVVCLYPTHGSDDLRSLSNVASTSIRDELTRVAGVAAVDIIGRQNVVLRFWLDPDRLAARNLSGLDIVNALAKQNVVAQLNPSGSLKESPITIVGGRAIDPNQLEDLIIRTDAQGQVVRLRDVARVEIGVARSGFAAFDSKPAVVLAIYPTATPKREEVAQAVRAKLAELQRRLPDGILREFPLPFSSLPVSSPPGGPAAGSPGAAALLLDVNTPRCGGSESEAAVLDRESQHLRTHPEVEHVLALSEEPCDRDPEQACLLVSLRPEQTDAAARQKFAGAIRTEFAQVEPGASLRIRDLTDAASRRVDPNGSDAVGGYAASVYPVQLAIYGLDPPKVRELARRLVARLSPDRRLTDVWGGPEPESCLWLEVDRRKALATGVALADISNTIRLGLDEKSLLNATFFDRDGRVRKDQPVDGLVRINTDRDKTNRFSANAGDFLAATLRRLQVKNNQGQMISLGAVIAFRDVSGLAIRERFDLFPSVTITAGLAPGASLAEVRSIVELLATAELAQELSAQYKFAWLREMPPRNVPGEHRSKERAPTQDEPKRVIPDKSSSRK